MTDAWIAFWAALGGSVVGASTTIIGMVVQSRLEARKHRQELALKMASEDRTQIISRAPPGAAIPPLSVFLQYYLGLVDHIQRGNLDQQAVLKLGEENEALFEAILAAQKKKE